MNTPHWVNTFHIVKDWESSQHLLHKGRSFYENPLRILEMIRVLDMEVIILMR